MGLAHFAEFRQLAVEAFHRAGVGDQEFGLAGEEEGAGTGFGAGESELELANETDGAAILTGEEVGLNAFLPIEIDGSDAEEKGEGADEDIEQLIERTKARHPGAHGLIIARRGSERMISPLVWLWPERAVAGAGYRAATVRERLRGSRDGSPGR